MALLSLILGCARPPDPPSTEKVPWTRLADYEYMPRMKFPEGLTGLSGKRIEISGYLYPTKETRNIREFILMKDPGTCCYGAQAKWTHFLQVRVVNGTGVNFTRDPIIVVGRFILDERFSGDYQDGLYYLEAEEHRKL